MSLSDVKIGFIGAGNMAQAIGLQFIKSGEVKPDNIVVSAPSQRFAGVWKEAGVNFTNDNTKVLASDVIFLAVKPQLLVSALSSIATVNMKPRVTFVSLAVGVMLGSLERELISTFGKTCHVVRVMPNTPCMVGAGCSVMCSSNRCLNEADELVLRLMRLTGSCDIVDEKLFDPFSALGGSGPAYMYMVIEALSDGAVKLGVPREMATQVAAQMMRGASEMVLKTGKHPGQLKDEVCSPGGTTICAVHELEKSGIRAAFMNALQAAVDRSQALAKNT